MLLQVLTCGRYGVTRTADYVGLVTKDYPVVDRQNPNDMQIATTNLKHLKGTLNVLNNDIEETGPAIIWMQRVTPTSVKGDGRH